MMQDLGKIVIIDDLTKEEREISVSNLVKISDLRK
jgi:hypothetical protein